MEVNIKKVTFGTYEIYVNHKGYKSIIDVPEGQYRLLRVCEYNSMNIALKLIDDALTGNWHDSDGEIIKCIRSIMNEF